MQALWDRLEAWVRANTDRTMAFRKGATEGDVAKAEKILGLRLPDDVRATFLHHDGQGHGEGTFEWMPGCSPLASLKSLVSQWKDEQELLDDQPAEPGLEEGGRVLGVLAHPRRVPIAGTEYWDGDNTYVDLAPGPKGREGQLLAMVSECDFAVLGESLRDALEAYVDALERGDWTWDAARGHVSPKGRKRGDYPNETEAFASWRAARAKAAKGAHAKGAPAKAAKGAKGAHAKGAPAKAAKGAPAKGAPAKKAAKKKSPR